ncbi:uncharacterized protein [Centroberyx affinis]|uniref:uncharacterized protein n=1 Tax=Centroberyx affinis TaxID=166261 RepID=UPI003A5C1C02
MMPVQWSILLLCLSANANRITQVKSGDNFTMECSTKQCSTMGCPVDVADHSGMYVYHGLIQREEVLYYYPKPGSTDKITLRRNYWGRVQTQGTLTSNAVTISRLTVRDSGIYACVYHKFPHREVLCNVYVLIVKEELPYPRQVESKEATTTDPMKAPATTPTPTVHCVPLVLIIVNCAFAALVAVIATLLVVLRVKRCIESRGEERKPQAPNDYVYEEMSRNGFQRPSATAQTSSHL